MGAIKNLSLILLTLPGCVSTFEGSNVELDLAKTFPAQASAYGPASPGQFEPNSHFALYALDDFTDGTKTGQRLFELQRFEIHPVVDVASPCFIDVGPHVPYPGLHVTEFAHQVAIDTGISDVTNPPPTATREQQILMATAIQREANIVALGAPVGGLKVITTASEKSYPAVAADCNGPDDQIPPPTCVEPAANARRLKLCQAAWANDPDYFEGTDRTLSVGLDGVTYGPLDGINPINLAPIGGAGFFIDEAVAGSSAYAIYHQVDGAPPPGDLILYGEPVKVTRGVLHVHLKSVSNPSLAGDIAIFANIGEDDVHF
jgi:hypothetical protein